MSFFKITLQRSAIGLPQRTRDVLAALGLRKRHQVVVHEVNPSIAGLLFSAKELVQVTEVSTNREETLAKVKAARRPAPGFTVVARRQEQPQDAPESA